jgi:hypothetical protein
MRYIFILISLFFSLISNGQVDIINRSLTDSSLDYLYIGVDNRIAVNGSSDNYKWLLQAVEEVI